MTTEFKYFLPITIVLLAIFLANATAKSDVVQSWTSAPARVVSTR